MSYFDKASQFKLGDVFYECEAGRNIEARVTRVPVAGQHGDGSRFLDWVAENTQNGEEITYRLTENLEHYGPRLYDQPQYGGMRNGEFIMPLVGAKE